jgi:hypothetical protein
MMQVSGPYVLPQASQLYRCNRDAVCNVPHLNGTQPLFSQLAIASGECGTTPPAGAPNQGLSEYSPDGASYTWGNEAIKVMPGEYRLCWCPTVGFCTRASDFTSFAAMLQVKGVLRSNGLYICALGMPCVVDSIAGQNLDSTDRIMVMTSCSTGVQAAGFQENGGISVNTSGDGSTFTLPVPTEFGVYRLCWCAGEFGCNSASLFATEVGQMKVGGPHHNAMYVCYEWEPCAITITGVALEDGDRLKVIPNEDVCTSTIDLVAGFPQDGFSDGATGEGVTFSWGDSLMRTVPGIYKLCWCSNATTPNGCDAPDALYTVPAGSIRIGTSAEWQYLQRPPDPEDRGSQEDYLPYFLAIPLPFMFCMAIVGGRALMRSKRFKPIENFSLFPKKKLTEHERGQEKDLALFEISTVQNTRVTAVSQRTSTNFHLSKRDAINIPNFHLANFDVEQPDDRMSSFGLPGTVVQSATRQAGAQRSVSPAMESRESPRRARKHQKVPEPPQPPGMDVVDAHRLAGAESRARPLRDARQAAAWSHPSQPSLPPEHMM